MHHVVRPRWPVPVILLSVLACGVLVSTQVTGPDDALLHSLSARLPFAAAGTVAAPLLSGLLGVGFGLLVMRRQGWADQRLRALILTGAAVCLVWLTLVSVFWFAVQGEVLPLLAQDPTAQAGLSTLSTLLAPSTAVVFGAAVAIAVHVRATARIVAVEAHVQTTRSRGLPTTGPIIRRVLRRTLPAVVAVQLVEFLVLYGGSLTVQAAFTTPTFAADLPVLLPAETLPLVLGATLLGIVSFVVAGVALATSAPASVTAAPGHPPTGVGLEALLTSSQLMSSQLAPADPRPTLASTGFRAADFLDIRDLRTHATGTRVQREPLAGVSLTVARGQTLAVIGDDPEGTSLLCHSIAGLQQLQQTTMSGSILIDGLELVGLPERDFRHLRGQRIGFLAAPDGDRLDPAASIGNHLVTLLTRHTGTTRSHARSDAIGLLERVGCEDPSAVFSARPGAVTPATCQRVLLAGALIGGPQLLVADDPTRGFTEGDEAGFLDLLHSLQRERGFTLVVASPRVTAAIRSDRVAIMSEGAIVEYASVAELLTAPRHPYTQRLFGSARLPLS